MARVDQAILFVHRYRVLVACAVLVVWGFAARCCGDRAGSKPAKSVLAREPGASIAWAPTATHVAAVERARLGESAVDSGGSEAADVAQPSGYEPAQPEPQELTCPTAAMGPDGGMFHTGDRARDTFLLVGPMIDRCIEAALKSAPTMHGVLSMAIHTTPDNGRYRIVDVGLNSPDNEIADRSLLECARTYLVGRELDDVVADTFEMASFVTLKRGSSAGGSAPIYGESDE